ncbi:MAG: RbsD/FucU domain-containing protein [Sphaerochaeta sp.]
MLRGIPKILPPCLVKYMMEMGHSDFLVLADANFPGSAHAKRVVRMDSASISEILEAMLPLYPLDNFVTDPVKLMLNLPSEPVPKVWETYRSIITSCDKDDAFTDFVFRDRFDFYAIAEHAYLVVQTSDTSRYGNIILQKGVC